MYKKIYTYKVKSLASKDRELKKIYKRCSKCKEIKFVKHFYKSSRYCDGYRCSCKKCSSFKKAKYKFICKSCGKEFETYYKEQIYCSKKCSCEGRKNKINITCDVCGKEYRIIKSRYEKSKYHFCSRKCLSKGMSKFYKGENRYNYSKVKTICSQCNKEIYVEKGKFKKHINHFCSKECLYKFRVGENSPRWNPDRTHEQRQKERKENKYYNWRIAVFNKDNYQCKCCGDEKGHTFIAHHIESYNSNKEGRYDVNNGITLCDKCHKKFHKLYGYGNNTKEQLKEFLEYYKEDYKPRVMKGGKGISVICLNTGKVFYKVKDAAEYYGISRGSHITDVCKGKAKSSGKHPDTKEKLKWMYYDEYIKINK